MTDLFAYGDSRPNYRPSDPITSRDAGRAAHRFTADHHQAILTVLRRSGRPMAPEEISGALNFLYARGFVSIALDTVQVCKRAAEMIEDGLIERTAEQHKNRSGRSAFKLRIKQPQSETAANSSELPRG